jgi:hypothetical protein
MAGERAGSEGERLGDGKLRVGQRIGQPPISFGIFKNSDIRVIDLMSYRPSRGLVLCMIPLLATATAGAWAWNKANDVPLHERANGDFLALVKKKRDPLSEGREDTPAARRALREGCAAMKRKMLQEHPGLRIEEKPVPDEHNAFLQLHKLAGFPTGRGPVIGENLQQFLSGNAEWDSAKVRAALAEESELVALAEKIGAMTERSSSNMPEDYNGFISARTAKYLGDILMMKARLASESQDPQEVLRLVAATRNLASHFREIESPTLLGETVTILVDLNAAAASFEHLFPALGPEADLAAWKEALVPRGYTPADFAHVMRGEWNITAEFYLYPAILRQKLSDGEELARLHAANFERLVMELPEMGWAEFAEKGVTALEEDMSGLSEKGQEVARAFLIGNAGWHKGYMRAVSVFALHEAALDLMILEQGGEPLAAESVSKLKPDPVSGKSYRFDPATRTLSAPEEIEAANVKPVKLPW